MIVFLLHPTKIQQFAPDKNGGWKTLRILSYWLPGRLISLTNVAFGAVDYGKKNPAKELVS